MRPRFLSTLLFVPLVAGPATAGEEDLPNLPEPVGVHALARARVVIEPGRLLEEATVVIRGGVIEAVGEDLEPPPDARVWDLTGKTVYPGLIDPYTSVGLPAKAAKQPRGERRGSPREEAPRKREPSRGPAHELPSVHPERRAADLVQPTAETLEAWRAAGFTTVVVALPEGIFRGSAAVLNLGDGGPRANLIEEEVAQTVGFDHGGFRSREYPASTMGAMAVLRQTLLDAAHYRTAWSAYRAAPSGRKRPEVNRALAGLGSVVDGTRRVILETEDLLGLVRAGGLAAEFGLRALLVGSGEEYRHLDWVRSAGSSLLLPVNFPPAPAVGDEGPALDVTTAELRHWYRAPENPGLLHGAGIPFALTAHGLDRPGDLRKKLREAMERGLGPDAALDALTRSPARLLGLDERMGTVEAGKMANLLVADGELFAEKTRVVEVWIDGRRYEAAPEKDAKKDADRKVAEKKEETETEEKKAEPVEIPWAPEPGPLATPPAVLVRRATIWTQGPEGTLTDVDLLVRDGLVEQVGRGLAAPRGTRLVAAQGRHVTPGLIDAHSHSATAESVNEGTHAVTAEVRVADVLDPDSPTLYRLLAGGLTTANVLHGSANPIGGQNAVIKMRLGATPEGLLVPGAPPGIKFALGENVKQSNWGDDYTTRYPQTRMGVEQVIRQAFLAARDYQARWDRFEREGRAGGADPVPPRRDLQLEALAEILSGERLVHCHSYRQDEILGLVRLADELGFRVATFQHVLEGYKVGPELAEHGAGASTFSDWWAYKFEVYDAIPYNGALLYEAGVTVSFNSDSSELARRLNLEAAKAVKYGGVPPEDALRFVTLNPARQLGLDERLGSLEPGKEADFVLWSGDPLSTRTVAEQTWVGGALYFDRKEDGPRREALAAEREALIRAARAAGEAKR